MTTALEDTQALRIATELLREEVNKICNEFAGKYNKTEYEVKLTTILNNYAVIAYSAMLSSDQLYFLDYYAKTAYNRYPMSGYRYYGYRQYCIDKHIGKKKLISDSFDIWLNFFDTFKCIADSIGLHIYTFFTGVQEHVQKA